MLYNIIRFSIHNKLIIALFTFALIGWGYYSVRMLPIDAVPDITNNQVQIITQSPSLAAQEVERLISFPIEQAMATIPKIEEVRSISRFGLSVVTVVFKENVDIYWARQLVGEKLGTAVKDIPPNVGSPELAPISTGLGEIYQYVIHPTKGFEKKFSASDLRTIQDWIVRRQLLGIPGVADVSSFGGMLKQYEIALNPEQLRSYNISISEVYAALQANNQNTGGSYIDKKPNAYFIRTEGLIKTLGDIEKIAVKTTDNGSPVLIRNIATVQFGAANRYGALTLNATGEVVGAIVLMLKGENSNTVVNRVKDRIAEISKTLPEGIKIEPYLDRSALVNKAIHTVETNLMEGALIVIFVLVLFLGNFRAGLIVASVIPLALLFAICLMNLAGVSGNLMSLGAIDFGLVVDGAVIIVEASLHHLQLRKKNQPFSQHEMDEEVNTSASNIMNSAAFGEIIILAVYLPLLALTGIEGKMFRPMAQTVAFAILGAFILSLTYVPMISALFLNKTINSKKTISERMMHFFQRMYEPLLQAALKRKGMVVTTSVLLFILTLCVFMNMGGEFIPTLEEGDFAVETRLLTGSSLSESIEKIGMASDLLLTNFPEVKKVVGKIGSSEIPTDPMPIESADMIIVLKDKKHWVSADSREELAEKMNKKLDAIPGLNFSFQQPIQMRFNELISGVKQDIGIKIFGEDMNQLASLAAQIGKLANSVRGAKDLYIERVNGLPQIAVKIDREKIAKFGLSVEAVNMAVNTAFAGQKAGTVYEQEKRFDLVLRLGLQSRQSIQDVANLYITNREGKQIPLTQLADITMQIGPNEIQPEENKRRIVVGFNVRGRDVESVVNDLKKKIDAQIHLPAGYFIRYGGQFKNLQEAKSRLSVSVPVALLLIVLLLFFTFRSLKYALLIFTGIPMAAIGGVVALLLRGMPFSISAGVGFIALFGVAVLNGLVLIGEFNRLKQEGRFSLEEIVLQGTRSRLRPVLMTASVASLGFLPMALATSNGAEVQRPLATVVIGGLITSTLLTLIVLPCLYIYFETMRKNKSPITLSGAALFLLTVVCTSPTAAQTPILDAWINKATKTNSSLLAADKEILQYHYLKKTAGDIGKTNLGLQYGQYNSYAKMDNSFSIIQTIPFPSTMVAKSKLGNSLVESSLLKKNLTKAEVVYQVKSIYYEWLNLNQRKQLLLKKDSVYAALARLAALKYTSGESNLLEKSKAEARAAEAQNMLSQIENDQRSLAAQLKAILNEDISELSDQAPREATLLINPDSSLADKNPYVVYMKQQVEVAAARKRVEKNTVLPDLTLGYFNQSLYGVPLGYDASSPPATYSHRFQGLHAGISIPLWFAPHSARIKAAEQQKQSAELHYKQANSNAIAETEAAHQQYLKTKRALDYYKTTGLPNAELITKQSLLAFQKGEISYTENAINLQQAEEIRQNYLTTLLAYNKSIILIEFLSGLTN